MTDPYSGQPVYPPPPPSPYQDAKAPPQDEDYNPYADLPSQIYPPPPEPTNQPSVPPQYPQYPQYPQSPQYANPQPQAYYYQNSPSNPYPPPGPPLPADYKADGQVAGYPQAIYAPPPADSRADRQGSSSSSSDDSDRENNQVQDPRVMLCCGTNCFCCAMFLAFIFPPYGYILYCCYRLPNPAIANTAAIVATIGVICYCCSFIY